MLLNLMDTGEWANFSRKRIGEVISAANNERPSSEVRLVTDLEYLNDREAARREAEWLSKVGLHPEFDNPAFFENVTFFGFGLRDGDDIWLALDYQNGCDEILEPAVIASQFAAGGIRFVKVADTFGEFVTLISSAG